MEVCSPAGRAVRLLHNNVISSVWRLFNSPNPSDSGWFKFGATVSPRFNGGSNES